jgi:hypothetical protein
MTKATRILITALTVLLVVPLMFSQGSTTLPSPGRYGLTAWAINNQRVASQYDYYIDSVWGSGLGAYSFPPQVIYQAIPKGPLGQIDPFNTNATVKIIDINSSLTETVAFNSVSCTTGGGVSSVCTLSLANSNTHSSYILRSGTCGLREALNDLGANGGEVIIDQRFYDDGCTAATITGLTVGSSSPAIGTAGLQDNQYIHDISNGQDTWYNLQPSTLTTISAPTTSANLTCATTAGLVCQSATTGGTWPNSAEYVGEVYVDYLGGWSASSTTATLTPGASGTGVLQFNSPAATAGAAGWLPFGGLTYNSASYMLPVTSSVCTLSTQFTAYPVCAIGATATVTTPVTTTSLNPQYGGIAAAYNPNPQSHTTFAYRPSQRPGYQFQLNYGPFTACPALTAGQLCVVGTIQLPTGFLTTLGIGGTVRFSFDVSNTLTTPGTVTGVDVEIGNITNFSTGTPKVVCTLLDPTSTGTANVKYHEECDWTVNALTSTGSIMPGGFLVESVAGSGGGVVSAIAEQGAGTAVTADVLDQDSVYFVYLQTSGASTTTPPQLLDLKVEVLNN